MEEMRIQLGRHDAGKRSLAAYAAAAHRGRDQGRAHERRTLIGVPAVPPAGQNRRPCAQVLGERGLMAMVESLGDPSVMPKRIRPLPLGFAELRIQGADGRRIQDHTRCIGERAFRLCSRGGQLQHGLRSHGRDDHHIGVPLRAQPLDQLPVEDPRS